MEALLILARNANDADQAQITSLELTLRELTLIEQLIKQLTPVEVFTKSVCSDNGVMGGRFIAGYFTLVQFFKQTGDQQYLPEIRLFRAFFRLNLPRRVPLCDEDFVQAMLDPNCKKSDLFHDYISKDSCTALLNEFTERFNGNAAEAAADLAAGLNVQDQSNSVYSMITSLEDEHELPPFETVNNAEILAYLNSPRELKEPTEY